MKQVTTQGIILNRTDYGEADRILNFITPDHGKISGIAKGVRKSKSKLAGSIELFSVSELSFILGRSEIYTITSARLVRHYHNIVKNLDRTSLGYEFIRLTNKATEANAESAYFDLLNQAFLALDNVELNPQISDLWFKSQIIKLSGHSPNLQIDTAGQKLSADKKYNFDIDKMHFSQEEQGIYTANHIKFLRLCFAAAKPEILNKVLDSQNLIVNIEPLVSSILQKFIRI